MEAYTYTDKTTLPQSISRLQWLCDTMPALLLAVPADEFSRKPAPGKWSKKELLGHLIDSATNNHQRFVRAQFEEVPHIRYAQDEWNTCSRYSLMDAASLVNFWAAYNRHLAELVRHIPARDHARLCNTGQDRTIEWLFIDYVKHLEYHLHQMVDYPGEVTYP